MLGTDNKTISQLGIEGIIKGERRPSRRLPQQVRPTASRRRCYGTS
jgi:hypothetical protein